MTITLLHASTGRRSRTLGLEVWNGDARTDCPKPKKASIPGWRDLWHVGPPQNIFIYINWLLPLLPLPVYCDPGLSFSMVLRQVTFRHSCLHFPSGTQLSTTLQYFLGLFSVCGRASMLTIILPWLTSWFCSIMVIIILIHNRIYALILKPWLVCWLLYLTSTSVVVWPIGIAGYLFDTI